MELKFDKAKENLDIGQLNDEFMENKTLAPKFGGLAYKDGILVTLFKEVLTDIERPVVQQVVDTHVPKIKTEEQQAIEKVSDKIERAKTYGNLLMNDFAAENVVMGLTNEQIFQLVNLLTPVISLIGTGSLKLARGLWVQTNPIPVILEQERIDRYTNKLDYILKRL